MTINTDNYNDLELALMVLLGYLGNGQERRDRLGDRYDTVQNMVNHILAGDLPSSGGGSADPDRLAEAIDDVFRDTLDELREDIISNYDSK